MDILELYKKSHTHTVLSKDIVSGMVNHSYLLVSADVKLIHEYARLVASELLCTSSEAPCGQCTMCHRIAHGNFSDVLEYPRDKATIVTEDINNIILDEAVLPFESDIKIYILHDFDKSTVQAQNKLLKTLEEPNKSTVFILTASTIEGVLPTIRSRAKKIIEYPLDNATVYDYLIDMGIDADTARIVSDRAYGSITNAAELCSGSTSRGIVTLVDDMLNNMTDSSMMLKYSAGILKYKDDLAQVITHIMISVSHMSRLIVTGQSSKEYNLELYNIISLGQITKLCEEAIKKINANCNASAIVDSLLLGILEARYRCSNV